MMETPLLLHDEQQQQQQQQQQDVMGRVNTLGNVNATQYLWPEESARLVVLIDYNSNRNDTSSQLHITYNSQSNRFELYDSQDHHRVLDTIDPADIIGAHVEEEQEQESPVTLLSIYAYPRQKRSKTHGILGRWCFPNSSKPISPEERFHYGYRFACHRKFRIQYLIPSNHNTNHNSKEESQEQQIHLKNGKRNLDCIIQAIRCISGWNHSSSLFSSSIDSLNSSIGEETSTKNRLSNRSLVLVNPCSGTKNARKIYDTVVQPMFQQVGIQHDVILTQYAGHATEIVSRTHTKVEDDANNFPHDIRSYDALILMGGDGILFEVLQGLKSRPDFISLMDQLKLGIIGCGTANGLAASILHSSKEKYSPLESTFLICKGHTRKMDLSFYQTLQKSYLSFLTFSWGIIADIDIESEKIRFLGPLRLDAWAVWRVLNLRTYRAKLSYLSCEDVHWQGRDTTSRPTTIEDMAVITPVSMHETLPSHWKTMEGDFILFWASQVSHASFNVIQSPSSTLQDGIFQIMIVRYPCSRLEIASILLSLESGQHVSSPKVEFIKCVAYRLEPVTDANFNVLDGEVVEPGIIQGCVMPSIMNIFQ